MSIIPAVYNLKLFHGQSLDKAFILKDVNNIPIPLTNYLIEVSIADKDGKNLLQRGYVIEYDQGSFYWGFTKDQIAQLPPNTYLFDLVITYPDGKSDVYLRGTWTVLAGATI
jgi:hypothetical protein